MHPDFWVRRCALLHQLGWRLDTDTTRLQRYILLLVDYEELFLYVRRSAGHYVTMPAGTQRG